MILLKFAILSTFCLIHQPENIWDFIPVSSFIPLSRINFNRGSLYFWLVNKTVMEVSCVSGYRKYISRKLPVVSKNDVSPQLKELIKCSIHSRVYSNAFEFTQIISSDEKLPFAIYSRRRSEWQPDNDISLCSLTSSHTNE